MRRPDALRRIVGAVSSGLLYAGAQPGTGLWPLGFACFVPLLWAWRCAPLRERVGLAWIAGTVATTLATVEAGSTGASTYFGLGPLGSLGFALGIGQVFGAASFVAMALLAGDPLASNGRVASLRFGAAVAGAELLRGTLLTGFPWLLLAYSLLPAPELTGAAAYGGPVLVSLLLACTNAELAAAVLAPRRRTWAAAAAAAACSLLAVPGLLGAPARDGTVQLADGDEPAADALRLLLLQPGARAEEQPQSPAGAVAGLIRQTTEAPSFDVAVWPENALPAFLPANAHLVRPALAHRPDARLILGAPRAEPTAPGTLYTSALLLDSDARTLAHHDKVHLLPFAEYAPGPLPMRWFGALEATAGARPLPLADDGAVFGPLICYEVLFAELARQQARSAGILLNLSNDSWFGRAGASEQHLAAAMYRAVETARPVLRSTQTGITAAIDARGRVVARLPMNEAGRLLVDVVPGSGTTWALAWGSAPAWVAFGLVLLRSLPFRRAAARLRPRRRRRSPGAAPAPGRAGSVRG